MFSNVLLSFNPVYWYDICSRSWAIFIPKRLQALGSVLQDIKSLKVVFAAVCVWKILVLVSATEGGRGERVEASDRWTDHKRRCTCIWALLCTLIRGWRPIHPLRQMLSSTGDKGEKRWQASGAAGEGLGWSSAGRVKTGVGEVLGCQINGWTCGGIKVPAYWLLKIKI